MPDNKEISQHEVWVFSNFITRSGLPVDPYSVEKCHPPEPDILCRVSNEGFVAFELVEICDETIAKTINKLLRQTGPEEYVWPGNPLWRILRKKRGKKYQTDHPIELLVYAGMTVLPPDKIIFAIKFVFDYRPGTFRRVWFMGQPGETCECVVEWPEPQIPFDRNLQQRFELTPE